MWPPLLTTIAHLTLEVGLVVPLMLLVAYYVGWRSASAAGVSAAAALVVGVYVAARAALISELGSSPFYTETGFWLGVIEVPTQERLFGAFPFSSTATTPPRRC